MYTHSLRYTNVRVILYVFFIHTYSSDERICIRTLHSYAHSGNSVDIFTFQAPPTNGRYIYCYRILQAIDFLDKVYNIRSFCFTLSLFGSKEIKELISRNYYAYLV